MDSLQEVRSLLAESDDPDNPSAEELRALFQKAWHMAVVGLSRDPAKIARRVPAYLATKGFDIVPINPFADRILGQKALPSLAELEDPVDIVVIFRPSADAGSFVREAAARPEAPAIWLQEGIMAPDATRKAREQGRLVVQDLCSYKVLRALLPL